MPSLGLGLECYVDAAAARFASRDFLRLALFLWMMPRAAALSCADAAALTSASLGEAAAFRYKLLSAVFTAALRVRRFSDARDHFFAESILGKRPPLKERVPRTRKATKS